MDAFKRTHITSLGMWFILITLVIGLGAVNTGNNLLYFMTSMLLSLIIASGILSEVVLRGITLHREHPAHIFSKRQTNFRWRLENRKRWIPSFSIWIEEMDGDIADPVYLHRIPAYSSMQVDVTYLFKRRGVCRLKGFLVSTRFPFGLFLKKRFLRQREELLIYPSVRPVGGGYHRGTGLHDGGSVRIRGRGRELYGLRDYIEGEDSRLIHWKSSAKVSRLLMKEHEREDGRKVMVYLNNSQPHPIPPDFEERFEYLVEEAASIVSTLIKKGYLVGLCYRMGRIPVRGGTAHLYRVMKALATVTPVNVAGNGTIWQRGFSGGGCRVQRIEIAP